MRNYAFLLVITLASYTIPAVAQTSTSTTNVNTDVDVTTVYEQVVKEGYGTPFIYKELANAHYFKNNYADAKKWYEKLFEHEKPTDETIKFRYKQILKALKLDKEPNEYLSSNGSN